MVNIWCIIDSIHQQNLRLSEENTEEKSKRNYFKIKGQLQISCVNFRQIIFEIARLYKSFNDYKKKSDLIKKFKKLYYIKLGK